MVVSGEAFRMFKETHPERDFSDFWLEVSLNFSINSFDLSSFFLLRDDFTPATAASSSRSFVKTEPLALRLANTILLMLVILLKVMAATLDTLSIFHSDLDCNM
jgi:hypothetical protein